MRRLSSTALVALLAFAPLAFAQPAAPGAGAGDRAAERKALAAAVDTYNKARSQCRTLKGHERKVCFAEARAAYRTAEVQAVAQYRDTPRARMNAEINAANAELALARARCAGKPAGERTACRTAAKEAQRQAVAEAIRKERAASPGEAPATRLVAPPSTPATPPTPKAARGTAPAGAAGTATATAGAGGAAAKP